MFELADWLWYVMFYLCGLCTGVAATAFWLRVGVSPLDSMQSNKSFRPPAHAAKKSKVVVHTDEMDAEIEERHMNAKGWDATSEV